MSEPIIDAAEYWAGLDDVSAELFAEQQAESYEEWLVQPYLDSLYATEPQDGAPF